VARKVDVDKLVGAEEIAERLGLKRYQRVHELRSRDAEFPAPVVRLKRTMVWYWPDVERWARARGRLP
jgi:predicted DNA-binding transcriptional regulator AlpA